MVFPEIEGDEAFHEVANTLDLIEKLQPALILPGHGAPFRDLNGALTRARGKLTKFVNAPEQHAVYAAKVLLKFKLLEFQTIAFEEFVTWAGTASYLHLLHQKYATEQSFENWIRDLCTGMQRSGACVLQENTISNA